MTHELKLLLPIGGVGKKMGEELPEAVYRELLAEIRDAIKTAKKPMKSEIEEVQVFTVDAFL